MISCETLSILTGEGLPRLGASFLENWLSIALLVSMFALFLLYLNAIRSESALSSYLVDIWVDLK